MKPKVKTWLRNIRNGKIRSHEELILKENLNNTPMETLFDDRGGISTYELRRTLRISHQSLTSVLTRLSDEGLIKAISEVEHESSHYSVYAFIFDVNYRERLILLRKKEKFLKWLKRAEEFEELMDKPTYLILKSWIDVEHKALEF